MKLFAMLALLLPALSLSQSVPNGTITQGQVWTAAQWNAAWQSKTDYPAPCSAMPSFTGAFTSIGCVLSGVLANGYGGTGTTTGVPAATSITALAAAGALTGTESLICAQGGTAAKCTSAQIGTYVANTLTIPCSGDTSGATDTPVLQAAINAMPVGASYLGLGTCKYYINASLTIPFKGGFLIRGQGIDASLIIQVTPNTPVFTFTGPGTTNWRITDFAVESLANSTSTFTGSISNTGLLTVTVTNGWTFAVGQVVGINGLQTDTTITGLGTGTGGLGTYQLSTSPSTIGSSTISIANPLSIGFYFNAGSGNNIFNWVSDNIGCFNLFRCYSVAATNANNLWGVDIEQWVFSNSTGSFFWENGGAIGGQPRITLRAGYFNPVNNATAPQIEPIVLASIVDQFELADIEENTGLFGTTPMFSCQSCTNVIIHNVKSEASTVVGSTLAGVGPRLWDFSGSTPIVIIDSKIESVNITGSGVVATGIYNGGATGSLSIFGYTAGACSNNPACQGSDSGGNYMWAYNSPEIDVVSGLYLTFDASDKLSGQGNVPQARINVPHYTIDAAYSAGDAAQSPSVASGYRIAEFLTTLTANRTFTLPSTGLLDGQIFDVVRLASPPGNYYIDIYDSVSGRQWLIPPNSNGYCQLRTDGTSWYPLACGQVPAANATISTLITPNHISFQPGLVAAITNGKGAFYKVPLASTVDNIEVSASAFTCSVNPAVTLYECGTSTTCASPTTIGSATITAASTVVDGTVSSSQITAGDYVAWAVSAGTCTVLDIAGTAQIHNN